MRQLIVGCGYLGKRVADLWRHEGHSVFGTTRTEAHRQELETLGVEAVLCDVLDCRGLPSVDRVVMAVGLDRKSGQSMRDVYVTGLGNVLDHLSGTERFVYVSSSSVYGQSGGEWVDEDSLTEPQEESGKIVLEAERLLRARMPGAIVLRLGGIYGRGRLLRQKAVEAGEPIVGDGEKWLNLIHVEDGARAVVAALERAAPGSTLNVCDGQPMRRREFYGELARVLGASEPRFVSPGPGETPPHERANRRVSNRRLVEHLGFSFLYPDYRLGLAGSVLATEGTENTEKNAEK